MKKVTAEKRFTEVLALVESESVRQWAQTAHNKPIFLKMLEAALDKGAGGAPQFAAYMVALAMGLAD